MKVIFLGYINSDWRDEMKKLFVAFFVLLLASGCGVKHDSLSCQTTTNSNGITTTTHYDIDYMDNDVKMIKITYDYKQDNDTSNDNTKTNGTSDDNTATNGADNNQTTDTGSTREKQDGVNSDTDGISEEKDSNANLKSDDVVDGVVGDAIDSTIDGVTNTILDLAGIRTTYENQMNTYGNISGFSYKVDKDIDNEYKVIYSIDMDKISDSDLSKFNIPSRNFKDLKTNYQDLGYTCK